MTPRTLLGLAVAVLATACAGDAPTTPDDSFDPAVVKHPRAYRMSGEAIAHSTDGRTAECALDLIFELNEKVGKHRDYVEYTGGHGGDVARSVTDATGAGFGFSAFVGGAITMRRYRTGALEILIPINETTDVPFYRLMARWEGNRTRGRNFEGSWQCGPLQLDEGGYRDLDIVADGHWRLTPQ